MMEKKNFSNVLPKLCNKYYFLIPLSLKSNLIYLFIPSSQTGLH